MVLKINPQSSECPSCGKELEMRFFKIVEILINILAYVDMRF